MKTKTNVNYIRCAAIRVLLVVLFSLCVNPLYAQIQTNILGCRLGVSVKSSVERVFKQNGYELRKSEVTGLWDGAAFYDSVDGMNFGGVYWDFARVGFIDGKFSSIMFEKKYVSKEIFDKLSSALKGKYSRYLYHNSPNAIGFKDYNTSVGLDYYYFDGGYKITLSYGNLKLQQSAGESFNSSGVNDL